MLLLIDKLPAVTFLTSTEEYGFTRRYYEIGTCLIVCHNDLDIYQLKRQIVDVQIGWDTAQPGFVVDESRIGQRRTKIAIFRVIYSSHEHNAKLSEILG